MDVSIFNLFPVSGCLRCDVDGSFGLALDAEIRRLIEVLDAAWEGDDVPLKALMVRVLPPANQKLALESLRFQTISDEVIDTLFDNIESVLAIELLGWAMEMTDPSWE